MKSSSKALPNNGLHSRLLIRFALGSALLLLSVAAGCSGAKPSVNPRLAAEGAQLFGGSSAGSTADRSPDWRIVLATFGGPDAVKQAQLALPTIQARGGVPQAFVEPRRHGAIIAFGAYDNPGESSAQRDLKRLRAVQSDGVKVFPGAFLIPPQGGAPGVNPQLNLANARQLFGQSITYTLQVAIYEGDDRAEVRKLAEQAAEVYRRDGEQAFYYNGPSRSIVTIGLFTQKDFDPASGRVSDELKALMARHPNHLYNGMGVRERLPDGTTHMQPTRLVKIP